MPKHPIDGRVLKEIITGTEENQTVGIIVTDEYKLVALPAFDKHPLSQASSKTRLQ